MLTDLAADEDLATALVNSHSPSYEVSAFYGSDLTIEQLPVDTDGSITFDEAGQVQASGTIHALRDSAGVSYFPTGQTSPLAPFGQEVSISRRIGSGERSWLIPMGRYGISEVPDMREYLNADRVLAWDTRLSLKDRFKVFQDSDFLQPLAPLAGNGTWDEIRRICPFPILQTLADQPVPGSLTYGDSRYDALLLLMDNLGGLPAFTREGALTARAKQPWLTETVPVFEITGTIKVDKSMTANIYNAVRVRSSVGDNVILSLAQITDLGSPIRVGGPFNGGLPRTYGYASPLITTQGMADSTAATILARVSTQNAQRITVTTLPNPLLELGDYGTVHDAETGRIYTGSISRMTFSLNPFAPMTFDLIVSTVTEPI